MSKAKTGTSQTKKKKRQWVWVHVPQPPKFTAIDKTMTLSRVEKIIQQSPKMSQKVSRVNMRGNKIYLYELIEPFKSENTIFIKPLIDDKYLEVIYARITLNDKHGNDCAVDWQRHNNQWISLFDGTLEECIENIENDGAWFG